MSISGMTLARRYHLEDVVASGGMGDVWRATDTVLRRPVAVKILSDRVAGHPGFSARFRHEAQTMAALRHPGVADVYNYSASTKDSPAYLIMEYVEGDPLDRRIAAAGRLSAADTVTIIAQVAHALHAVHRAGVIHRDVKPGNLILRPDGSVVLVDFGVAYTDRFPGLTGVDEVVGTPHYMAPEQVGDQPLTPATDVYALGAVAYHCLAGHPPFAGDTPIAVVVRHLTDEPPPLPTGTPRALRRVVARAMAKNPADRFPNAAALGAAASAAAVRMPVAYHSLLATGRRSPGSVGPRVLRSVVRRSAGTGEPARRKLPVATLLATAAVSLGVTSGVLLSPGPARVLTEAAGPSAAPARPTPAPAGAASPSGAVRTGTRPIADPGSDPIGADWSGGGGAGAGAGVAYRQPASGGPVGISPALQGGAAAPASSGGGSGTWPSPVQPGATTPPASTGTGTPTPDPTPGPTDSPTVEPTPDPTTTATPNPTPTPDPTPTAQTADPSPTDAGTSAVPQA